MNELHKSLSIKLRASNNNQILLAGDFNVPDIDWENSSQVVNTPLFPKDLDL